MTNSEQVLRVAVGIVSDRQGRILLSRRPLHVHQGGLWEFPGGKLEAGESLQAGLQRELYEELGITVLDTAPLIRIRHRYPEFSVLLDVWHVTAFAGETRGREGQQLAWVERDRLIEYPLPAANRPIVTALRLPDCYVITPEPADPQVFLRRLAELVQAGAQLVQLRARSLDEGALIELAMQAVTVCRQGKARLLINGPADLVAACHADGVHLSSRELMSMTRRPLAKDQWVAASCHNLHEIRHAQDIEVDFVVLSPVCATASHPRAEPLGWSVFGQWTEQVALPVYALGGMAPEMISQAKKLGGQGIAAISAFWQADDVAAVLTACRNVT